MIADISHYQGEINWSAARKDLKLCIFRASVGFNPDNKYTSYTKNCGIPFGTYHYVKAGTEAEAEKEAKFFYETATQNGIQPLFFVADIEYETQTKTTTKPVTLKFIETLRTLGAKKVGLYIGQSHYPYIQDSLDKFDFIWIPRYGKNTGYADDTYKPTYPCDLWQYTSVGGVSGISGDVDLNKLNGTKTFEWFLSSENKVEEQKSQKEEKLMSNKMPIGVFMTELRKAVDRKDGYIMGATGQDPKKWSTTSWWYTQYSGSQKTKALYWREHAARVWDCNGLAEGLYKDYTGSDINTKARYNYSGWCSQKGTGMIPVNKRVPGAAVYWGSKASSITHVAYLDRPVTEGKPDGDWYIIEARGVMYGVVRTKLYSRDPDFWGIMDKYFDYANDELVAAPAYKLGNRLLKKGTKGSDVSELQTWLTKFGYLNDKIDGDFGSKTKKAVETFQKANGLTADGEYGQQTHKAMLVLIEKAQQQIPTTKVGQIVVTGSSVNVRYGDTTDFNKIGTVKKGEKLTFVLNEEKKPIISSNGWYAVYYGDFIGWISGKYAEVV